MHFSVTCFLFHSLASQSHALHNLEVTRKYFEVQRCPQPTRCSKICFTDSFKLALHVSGDSFAHLQENFDCIYSFLEKWTYSVVCCQPVTQIGWNWMKLWCLFLLWGSWIHFMFYTPSTHKQYVHMFYLRNTLSSQNQATYGVSSRIRSVCSNAMGATNFRTYSQALSTLQDKDRRKNH